MIPDISLPFLDDAEEFFNTYLNEKVPHIPSDAKATIVKFLPIAVIVMVIAQLASIMSFFQVNSLFAGLGYLYGISEGVIGMIGVILIGVAVVLELASVQPLFHHSRKGWKLLFYAVLLGSLNDLININLINFVFGGLLILYILFQVRESYR